MIKNFLRYPFGDWKHFLILGMFILISNIFINPKTYPVLYSVLFIIGCVFGLFIMGYALRIIKSSLMGLEGLPQFNHWMELFLDGIRVLGVIFIFISPIIIFLLVFDLTSFILIFSILLNGFSPLLGVYIENILFNFVFSTGTLSLLVMLYTIVIVPILFIAVPYMAANGNKFNFAFKFHEIYEKILSKGFKNVLGEYLLIGIFIIAIYNLGVVLSIPLIRPIGILVFSLIVAPYILISLSRLIALFYRENLNIPAKHIVLIIFIIVGLLVLTFSLNGAILDKTNKNSITTFNTTTNTYSAQDISFNYPSNWTLNTNYQGSITYIMINYPLKEDSSDTQNEDIISTKGRNAPQFQVTIDNNHLERSDQDIINSIKNTPINGLQAISNNTFTLNENIAFEQISRNNYYNQSMTFQTIYIVKNGTTYTINIQAPTNDFENLKPIFDNMINSFRIN